MARRLAVVPALFLLVALRSRACSSRYGELASVRKHSHRLSASSMRNWKFGTDVASVVVKVALPKVSQVSAGCLADHVKACRMDCPVQYQDPQRYLCPCYSKLGQCLVRIGCSMKQRVDVATFCSRRGYCKDGYCKFRAGDLTPRGDTRPEVFDFTSVKTPGTPCIDNCCPTWSNCTQNSTLLAVRNPGRIYREEEVLLPPREGDPRLGVNQNYDRMPYSIPLANLP